MFSGLFCCKNHIWHRVEQLLDYSLKNDYNLLANNELKYKNMGCGSQEKLTCAPSGRQ